MDSKQPKGSIFLSTLSAAFFILWGGLLIVNPAMAANITVCPVGCNCTAIQAGIDMASSGDTVLVGTPGRTLPAEIYSGNFIMEIGVDVKSEGDDSNTTYTGSSHTTTAMNRAILTIIQGSGSDSVVRFSDNMTADVTLDGFIIDNVTATAADTFLIRISGSPTIRNNIIRNNTGTGHSGGIGVQSFVAEPAGPLIENNLIHTVNGPGIGNGQNSNATIRNNEIWDCNGNMGPGIGLWGYAAPTIENNTIFGNERAGIGSYGNQLNTEGGTLTIPTIKGNTIYDNTGSAGIRLSRADLDTGTITVTIGDSVSGNTIYGNWAGIRLDNLTNGTIENNNIHDQILSGIWLDGVTTAIIHGNQINYQHLAGIRLDKIDNITISDNDIHHSSAMAGIRFYTTVIQATVENNRIYENGKAGIRNQGANTLKVQDNNHIYSNAMAGIFIDRNNSTNIIVGNNTIRENSQGGIRVTSAASVTVEDNSIYDNGWGGITNRSAANLFVNRNEIVNNGYGGIDIRGGIGEITGNTIRQNVYGGIGIKTPCTFVISENQINNNLRGGIHTGDQSADGGNYTGAPGTALLTIKKNKVYGNGQTGYGGGIDVRHARGVIYNNLVYENHRAGIRFGDNITEIVNNTVVKNGTNATRPGAGIVYDDLAGDVNAEPGGYATNDIPIKNNICTNNVRAGIRVNVDPTGACPTQRNYNLLCQNNGITDITCPPPPPYYCEYMQLYTCPANANEIFADPLFADPGSGNYTLQSGSPAENAGDDNNDMGAYGGDDPITP
jgi:parallel beta-helix repeat protein